MVTLRNALVADKAWPHAAATRTIQRAGRARRRDRPTDGRGAGLFGGSMDGDSPAVGDEAMGGPLPRRKLAGRTSCASPRTACRGRRTLPSGRQRADSASPLELASVAGEQGPTTKLTGLSVGVGGQPGGDDGAQGHQLCAKAIRGLAAGRLHHGQAMRLSSSMPPKGSGSESPFYAVPIQSAAAPSGEPGGGPTLHPSGQGALHNRITSASTRQTAAYGGLGSASAHSPWRIAGPPAPGSPRLATLTRGLPYA